MAIGRVTRFKNQLHAGWKWLLSFRKNDWCFEDYPVAIRIQEPDPESIYKAPRFTQHRYSAYIVNWWLDGGGDTPDDARQKLRENFESAKRKSLLEGKLLTRPGVDKPLEFASRAHVSANKELSEDFTRRVLGLEWAWISDESSLWDFHADPDNEKLYAQIREVYGVDVSDIHSASLWEIFDRIARSRSNAPHK